MPGLSLEHRYTLIREAERRAIAAAGLTPADARVLRVLCFDFHNGATGRCDPGHRAIALRAGCSRSTVSRAIARLAAAGFLTAARRWVRAAGRLVRWTHAFVLAEIVPPAARSTLMPKPQSQVIAQEGQRSVAAQLAYLRRWAAERGA